MKKIKELFYLWAFLDLEGNCSKKDNYFVHSRQEIGLENLRSIRSISLFLCIICIFVIASTYSYFNTPILRTFYLMGLFSMASIFILCTILLKLELPSSVHTTLTTLYLAFILGLGGYIGVVYSPEESATVYVAVLAISSMIFTITPIRCTLVITLSTFLTLLASYHVKSSEWFQSDVLNCVSVLILSLLLGWRVNKIRAEEALTRSRIFALNEELQRISVTDRLTNLPNHRSFQDTYYQMFDQARTQGHRIGVIMMDLDKFKAYNDNYGHIQGDNCLRATAAAFATCVEEGVTVYRYGGEEFIALLDDAACDYAPAVGERLRQSVEALAIPHAYSSAANIVTVSLGLYIGIPRAHDQPTAFVDCADKAMYHSKRKGRNRITTEKSYSPLANPEIALK